jgi:hypothetical protein
MKQLCAARRTWKERNPKDRNSTSGTLRLIQNAEDSLGTSASSSLPQDSPGMSRKRKRTIAYCSPMSEQQVLESSDGDSDNDADDDEDENDASESSCEFIGSSSVTGTGKTMTAAEKIIQMHTSKQFRPALDKPKQVEQKVDNTKKYMDWCAGTMMRLHASGALSPAKLKPGPSGFQIAVWEDGEQMDTELPNLQTNPEAVQVLKKPAMACKRPAHKVSQDSEDCQEEEVDVEADIASAEEEEETHNPLPDDLEVLDSFSGFSHPIHGQLCGGCYSGQSYIQAKHENQKKHLLIAVSLKQTINHKLVCNRIFRWLLSHPSASKDELVQQRTHELESMLM